MRSLRYLSAIALVFSLASFVWTGGGSIQSLPPSGDSQPCFLVLSDIHLNEDKPMSTAYNGSGDSGFDLWNAAKDKISAVLKERKPSFILLLGDLAMHHALPDDSGRAKKEITAVTGSLKQLAADENIPFIYVTGNNDVPGHHNGYFSQGYFRTYTGSTGDWAMASGAVAYPPDGRPSDLGFYSLWPMPDHKLRIVALNTVPYLTKTNDTTQLIWLRVQLKAAKALGEKVLIAMHVPPGVNYEGKRSWKFDQVCRQEVFLRSIEPYSDIVVGILTSHTHKEGLKVYNDGKGKLMDVGLSIPGIAPGHGNYPAMNIINYEAGSYKLEDVLTYYHTYSADSSRAGVNVSKWGNESISLYKDILHQPAGTSLSDLIRNAPSDSVIAWQRGIENMLNEEGVKRHDNPKSITVTGGCD